MTTITPQEQIRKEKNSRLSLILIAVNIILAFVFSLTIQPSGEEIGMLSFFLVLIALIICLIIYAFSYHGKGYRWAKWVLLIAVIVAIGSFIFLLLAFR